MKQTRKQYCCNECGHRIKETTNHYGQFYSWGSVYACPSCPPYKRPTVWQCMDEPPEGTIIPENWKAAIINVNSTRTPKE